MIAREHEAAMVECTREGVGGWMTRWSVETETAAPDLGMSHTRENGERDNDEQHAPRHPRASHDEFSKFSILLSQTWCSR
jgi:hypothetical protein